MKRALTCLASVLTAFAISSSFFIVKPVYAAQSTTNTSSILYSLKSFGEDVRLFFTFSKDQKVEYLLTLTQNRVDEMATVPSAQVGDRYIKHYQDLENLSSQVPDKSAVVQKIEDNSLRQQAVLAGVYIKVPDAAKEVVLGAQTASSEHVTNTIQAVEGQKSANSYQTQVQVIQKAEQQGRIDQVQMEQGPNPNPSENNINSIKGGQGINPLNPANSQNGGAGMEPAAPIQMK